MQNRLKDVVFVGYLSYNELPRYYKTADVFVLQPLVEKVLDGSS